MMRGFIFRTLRDTVMGSVNLRPCFVPSLVHIKCVTSAAGTNEVMVSYLQESCGLSRKDALSTSRKLTDYYSEDTAQPDCVIAFLKSHGFSKTQISKTIKARPNLLRANIDTALLPKVEYLYSRGFSKRDLPKIFSTNGLFTRSLKNHIIPKFDYLSVVFESTEIANDVISWKPEILYEDVETDLVPYLDVLRNVGVPEKNFLLFLKLRCQKSVDMLKKCVNEIREMGFDPLSRKFVEAVCVKLYGYAYWEDRVGIYKRGWTEEQVLTAFRSDPQCMLACKTKIITVLDFLVKKMNVEVDSLTVLHYPTILGYSFEKRIVPRATVFKFMQTKGLINKEKTNIFDFIMMVENHFQTLLKSYEEGPELLKLYQESKAKDLSE